MIHTLHLRNFKGIEAADLRFERFTVLVGPNASGKTSVLQALDLLSSVSDPKVDRSLVIQKHGGVAALGRTGEAKVLVSASGMWGQHRSDLLMELQATRQHPPMPLAQSLKVSGSWPGSDPHPIHEAMRAGMRVGTRVGVELPPSLMTWREEALLSASWGMRPGEKVHLESEVPPELEVWHASILLRLEARRLAEPSYTTSVDPRIDSDGTGLASALAQMALNRPEDFAELLSALRAVIPQVVRVRLSLAEITRQETETLRINEESISRSVTRSYSGHRILLDTKSGTGIPSEAASEGTLLVLGLLSVLMSAPRPKLVLLDDLDRGLHPRAQRDLVTQLRKLLERDPELQIIATSHSPYLVDHLEPREVRLSTALPDGTIRFAALTEHPDFERWKEEMRPGEFWSTVGEAWVGERKVKPTS